MKTSHLVPRTGRRLSEGAKARRSRRAARPGVDLLERRDLLTGTWTQSNFLGLQPVVQLSMLLPDGSVMLQGGSNIPTNEWYRLTPDASGNYADGVVTQLPNSRLQRLFFTSDVLKDGRVFVAGGEYTGPIDQKTFAAVLTDDNSAEIYDPVANTWTDVASFPESKLGDAPSEVMADGEVLVGSPNSSSTYFYNPSTNTWRSGPSLLNGDTSSEEGWVKLPDGSILSYEINGSNPLSAQRYVPSLNQWVYAGNLAEQLHNNAGNPKLSPELGPSILLPDGRVFWVGANSHTALYTPPTTPTGTGSWAVGPDIPGGLGAFDAPIAIEPNGVVMFTAQILDGYYNDGVNVFEYDYRTNVISPVSLPAVSNNLDFIAHFTVLPNGQILYTDSVQTQQFYTQDPTIGGSQSWAPTVSSITPTGANTYTLTGTQLNGLSEGSTYGDDAEDASNFPIVRITDTAGNVQYARTSNWSSTGVQTGSTPVTAQFAAPQGLADGGYLLQVVANGIASTPVLWVVDHSNSTGLSVRTDPAKPSNYQVLLGGAVQGTWAIGLFSSIDLDVWAYTTVDIAETPFLVPLTLAGAGLDNVVVGDNGSVQGILGGVYLTNPMAYNTIRVDDSADRTGRTATVSTYTDPSGSNWGLISGLAPAGVNYLLADTASGIVVDGGSGGNNITIAGGADTQAMTVNSGSGNDTVTVDYNLAPLTIDGGGGRDQVVLGNGYTAGINATIDVLDNAGAAAILVDDHLDTGSNTVTLNDGQLTGISPSPILWTPTATGAGGVHSLRVLGGTGSDTWNVVNTSNFGPAVNGGVTYLQTGVGSSSAPTVNVQNTRGILDIDGSSSVQRVTIGSNGTLQGINGLVDVLNTSQSGASSLALYNNADTVGRTVTMADGQITGLAPAPIDWIDNAPGSAYGGVVALTIDGGGGGNTWNIAGVGRLAFGTNLLTGTGGKADAVNLRAAAGMLDIDGGMDNATVRIGSLAPATGGTLANILGNVLVEDASGLGATTLILDDSGDAQSKTATLGDGSLAGFAPGSIRWVDYQTPGLGGGGVNALQILGGSGGNTFTVSTTAPTVSVSLSTGTGNDSVNVDSTNSSLTLANPGGNDTLKIGSTAPALGATLATINGPLTIAAGAGGTVLQLDDGGDASARTVTLADDGKGHGSIAGLSPYPITWVDATVAAGGVTGLVLRGGSGGNAINVANTGAFIRGVTLYPGTGNNALNVTGLSGPLYLYNNGGPASQARFVVDSTYDGASFPLGKLSLRQAVGLAASMGTEADPAVVSFDPYVFSTPQTITLTAGELLLNGNETIAGPSNGGGPDLLTINGGNSSRVFDIQGGLSGFDVALEDLVITGGLAGSSAANSLGAGGGVLVNDANGTVTLDSLAIANNKAILTSATSTAVGGGLYIAGGIVRLTNSTLSGNLAQGNTALGGAILLNGGALQLDDDTIANNTAQAAVGGKGQGGGLYVNAGSLGIVASTIAGNAARGGTAQGGGLFIQPQASVRLVNNIVAGNNATAGPDVSGTVSLSDRDLIGNPAGSVGFGVANGDLLNVNPNLAPLGGYGGPTQTMPPQAGSPAINAGDGFGAPPGTLPGLVDEWRGDGNGLDATGANPLTAQGGVAYIPGLLGRAFLLDGSTGYLQTAPNPAGLAVTGTITVSAWVDITVYKSDNVIIDKTQTGDAASYRFGVHGNQLFFFNGSTAVFSTGTIPLNTFTHVAFTLDASSNTLKFYINGVLDSTQAMTFGAPNAGAVLVGRDLPGRFFQGLLDEVQVYNAILTPSQVQLLSRAGSQPAAVLLDSWSADGNTKDGAGTADGAAYGNFGYAPGISGQAFNFGAGGGFVDVGTSADVVGQGAFAVGAWIRTTSDGMIINQRDANNFNGEYMLAVANGKVSWATYGGGAYGFNFSSNRSVADGQWHYVVAQRLANGTGQIFIDGALDNSQAGTAVSLASGIYVYIGEDVRNATLSSAPNNFLGQIDEVRIYGGALTPAQVQLLVNAPAGLARDQQGNPRPINALVDIGAVEYQPGGPSGVDIKGQPTDSSFGRPLHRIVVWVVDAAGRPVTDSNQLVTLAIATGPAGAILGGTTTVRAVDGLATFDDLTLNLTGTYTLKATGGTLDADFSNAFNVVPAVVTSEVRVDRGVPRFVGPIGADGDVPIEQTLTITNTGDRTLAGPLDLFAEDVPGTISLLNTSGTYLGHPYVEVLDARHALAPNQSVTVTLTFRVPEKMVQQGGDDDYPIDLVAGI